MTLPHGLTRWIERRPEAAALVVLPILLLVQWALALALETAAGAAGWSLYVGLMLLAWTVLAVAGSERVWVAAILGPVAVGVVATVALAVVGSPLAPLTIAAAIAWLALWIAAWERIWPVWAHRVLRRPRPDPFDLAYGRIRRRLDDMTSASDARDLWTQVVALNQWRTGRTAGLIDGLLAWSDLGAREGDAVRAQRLRARLSEETAAYRASDPLAPDVDAHPERPTYGTQLEFLFPELEALLALAAPDQQRRMAVEAARSACQREGVLDDALGIAFDVAAAGRPDPAARAILDPELAAPPADAEPAVFDRAFARLSAWRAMADRLDPNDAGDAIYDAARTCDDAQLAALAEQLGTILDEPTCARAREVEPDPAVLARTRAATAARQDEPEEWSPRRMVPPGLPLGGLVIVGLVAGVIGTALREPLWPLIEGLRWRSSLDVNLGAIFVALVAWVLLRVARRTNGSVVIGLFVASYIAMLLIDPLVAAGDAVLSRIAPDFWTAVYVDPPTALPYAPYHGIAFAAVLVVLALLVRTDARPKRPSAARTPEADA